MDRRELTIDAFAKALGEKPQLLKDIFRGRQRVPEQVLAALVRMNEDVGYLLTGIQTAEPVPAIVAENLSTSGFELTEYRGLDQILTGNADIANSDRGTPTPDTRTCTLPMYPQQSDLPQHVIVRGVVCAR